jgi:hypothetical protein
MRGNVIDNAVYGLRYCWPKEVGLPEEVISWLRALTPCICVMIPADNQKRSVRVTKVTTYRKRSTQ